LEPFHGVGRVGLLKVDVDDVLTAVYTDCPVEKPTTAVTSTIRPPITKRRGAARRKACSLPNQGEDVLRRRPTEKPGDLCECPILGQTKPQGLCNIVSHAAHRAAASGIARFLEELRRQAHRLQLVAHARRAPELSRSPGSTAKSSAGVDTGGEDSASSPQRYPLFGLSPQPPACSPSGPRGAPHLYSTWVEDACGGISTLRRPPTSATKVIMSWLAEGASETWVNRSRHPGPGVPRADRRRASVRRRRRAGCSTGGHDATREPAGRDGRAAHHHSPSRQSFPIIYLMTHLLLRWGRGPLRLSVPIAVESGVVYLRHEVRCPTYPRHPATEGQQRARHPHREPPPPRPDPHPPRASRAHRLPPNRRPSLTFLTGPGEHEPDSAGCLRSVGRIRPTNRPTSLRHPAQHT
jgi:hypothetical protein